MKIKLLCSIQNFKMEANYNHINFPPFIISNLPEMLDEQFGFQNLANFGGKFNFDEIANLPFIYYQGELSEIRPQEYENLELTIVAELMYSYFENILGTLWFIKDNSVTITHCYIVNLDGQQIAQATSNNFYSNASANYVDTEFSMKEIDQISSLGSLISNNFMVKTPDLHKYRPEKSKNGQIVARMGEFLPYNQFTRLQRAYRFLKNARSSTLLALKISNYIIVFECLFSTDSTEITHKICERIAYFIGGDREQKKATYDLVKSAYDVRSKYVHGQMLPSKFSTRDQLSALSISIDNLTRQIFLKIGHFDADNFKLNNNDIAVYFKDLIFS